MFVKIEAITEINHPEIFSSTATLYRKKSNQYSFQQYTLEITRKRTQNVSEWEVFK